MFESAFDKRFLAAFEDIVDDSAAEQSQQHAYRSARDRPNDSRLPGQQACDSWQRQQNQGGQPAMPTGARHGRNHRR